MALQILHEVSQKIHDSACFSIMADESTAWYCKKGAVHNQHQVGWSGPSVSWRLHWPLLGRKYWCKLSGLHHHALLWMWLQLSACCDQCYDGTSNMSGNRNGVVTQISTKRNVQSMYTVMDIHSTLMLVNNQTVQTLSRNSSWGYQAHLPSFSQEECGLQLNQIRTHWKRYWNLHSYILPYKVHCLWGFD